MHAALGGGFIDFGNTGGMNLPDIIAGSSADASLTGGIFIGYGAYPDSIYLPADKHLITQGFTRGRLELFNLIQQGNAATPSLILTDSASLYIEASRFKGQLTATAPVLGLVSSVFKQFSSFTKTGNLPGSFVDDVIFYDSVSFQHLGASGDFLFGTRDSQLLKTGGSGADSLLRLLPVFPPIIAIDRHPDRILMKAGVEILPNARYSAVISN